MKPNDEYEIDEPELCLDDQLEQQFSSISKNSQYFSQQQFYMNLFDNVKSFIYVNMYPCLLDNCKNYSDLEYLVKKNWLTVNSKEFRKWHLGHQDILLRMYQIFFKNLVTLEDWLHYAYIYSSKCECECFLFECNN